MQLGRRQARPHLHITRPRIYPCSRFYKTNAPRIISKLFFFVILKFNLARLLDKLKTQTRMNRRISNPSYFMSLAKINFNFF